MYSTYPSSDDAGDPSLQDAVRQCFSSIQSRKLWAPSCHNTCRLCPSMDLVIFGVQSPQTAAANTSSSGEQPSTGTADSKTIPAATTLWIHRTVSWQRLATLTFEKPDGITRVTWSPDGRHLALASLDHRVMLYDVESLSNQTGSAYGGSAAGEATPNHVINFESGGNASYHYEQPKKILGLTWAHVGRPHPKAWKQSQNQVEDEISWSYRSRYLDRSSVFLPPSEYNSDSLEDSGIISTGINPAKGSLPTCKTPLSLLCVSMERSIELFLHGRYHILSLPRKVEVNDSNAVDVVCSYDLTQLIVHEKGSTRLSLYSLPALHRYRYHLQTVASLHSSITCHLTALQQSISEAANSWKSSMKPLNDKLEPLQRLLSNYGVDEPESEVLRQYILIGHTSASSNMANAMDQFFTGVQMNDQLLQRMERSLQGGLANVETLVRKGLISPARSLVYHVGELAGQLRFQQTTDDTHDEAAIHSLQRASEMVLLSVETLLTHIIESRFRLRDFVAWLRSTGSQVKARGTANQSVQRENAKKRRVSDAVLQRVLAYLSDDSSTDEKTLCEETKPNAGNLTERLLGMKVSDLLKDSPIMVSTVNNGRPASPRSVHEKFGLSKTTPTVAFAVQEAANASEIVFAQPRNSLSKFVLPEDFILPRLKTGSVVAIHSRLGRDACLTDDPLAESILDDESVSELGSKSFFCPMISSDFVDASNYGCTTFDCRQWSVVCQAGQSNDSHGPCESIQFFAIPLGWKDPSAMNEQTSMGDDDEAEDDETVTVAPFYLTTKLMLPPNCFVRDVAFYGDDGKSSLSSGIDSGTGKESRQKLGLVISRRVTLQSSVQSYQSEPLELWLVPYDNLQWQPVPSESLLLEARDVLNSCSAKVKPITVNNSDADCDNMDDDNDDIMAQVRVIASLPSGNDVEDATNNASSTMLMLSGSRGVAGVSWTSEGVTSLELLDLEEDEDDDRDDDEELEEEEEDDEDEDE